MAHEPITSSAEEDFGQVIEEQEQALAVERRGIHYIPVADRYARPRDLFWMWMGGLFNVETLVTGALLIAIGLSLPQALVVIVIGNISYLLVGAASLQGPRAGTATFAISRAAYGPNGSRGVSFLNWLTMLGYETLGLSLLVLAGLALFAKAGVQTSTGLKILCILLAAAIQFVLPLLGHAAILRALKYLTYPFVALFVIMAVLTAQRVHPSQLHQHGSGATLALGFALVFASAGLGWANQANDYSRYLPPDTSQRSIMGWVSAGSWIPGTALMIIGAAAASGDASASDPIAGLPKVFPAWFVVPYLIVILPQLFAINGLTLYSSGLSLQAVGLRLKRWQAVVLDTVLAAGLTFLITFLSSFYTFLSDLLLFVIIWIAPWAGVFLVDCWLRRNRYDPRSLFKRAGGLYWRTGGWHIPAIVAQVIGMVASASWIDTSVFEGPLSSRTNGADFSALMGFGFGAVVYWLLARKSVPAEVAVTPAAHE
jgi:nucleobase:cation symporter-1, NCS1 family